MTEDGNVNALSRCVLGLHITNDAIIIAPMGMSENGFLYVKIPLTIKANAKKQGQRTESTNLNFPLK